MLATEQTCYSCKRTLPLEEFNRKSRAKSGRRGECRECQRADRIRYMAEVDLDDLAARRRESKYKSRFKKSLREVEAIFSAAGNACEACGSLGDEASRLVLDHDHKCCPGEYTCGECIRGVLCRRCNVALGSIGDSIDALRGLLTYMEVRSG
jgi:hypothetical protein